MPPVYSMEISADRIKTNQEYSGRARVIFNSNENVDVSSDKTSKIDDTLSFSGNVVVVFREATLKANAITIRKQSDGTSLLEAEKFTLEKHLSNNN